MLSRNAKLTELFKTEHTALLLYAYRIVKNWDLSQDLVQEAFKRYLMHTKKNKTVIKKPKQWLYSAIRNAAIDRLRRKKVEARIMKLKREKLHTSFFKRLYQRDLGSPA